MNPSQPAQRAIEMLETQVTDLAGIRNATARDPSFKNWRQATLTVMQRVWPGDQVRSERFRRIPFSPADPRAEIRAVREQYSRGCQEAGRVLTGFIEEILEKGVPEVSDTALPHAPESDFEDGFPTLDLPVGNVLSHTDPATLAENLLAGLGDEPPQGKDPSFADPARLPTAPPAPAPAATLPSMVTQSNSKKGPSMKSRLRDLLGFAHLSAKSLAGLAREPESENSTAPPVLPADAIAPEPVGVDPRDRGILAIAAVPGAPSSTVPAAPTVTDAATVVPANWPMIPRRADAGSSPQLEQGPWPAALAPGAPATANAVPVPAAPVALPVEPPVSDKKSAPAPLAGSSPQDSTAAILSRPTTLRANIGKVSIESLISAEFRGAVPGEQSGAASASPPVPGLPGQAVNEVAANVPAAGTPPAGSPLDASPATPAPTPAPDRGVAARLRAVREPDSRAGDKDPVAPPADGDFADTAGGSVDSEAFARATEDFMRSSPVLGASPRRAQRTADDHGFGDPDAIAVSSMVQELARMEVPQERHAEVRARLMDLARRLERGELEWSALRKAVWFAMEHPELARRLIPVLLPWIDRAA